VSVRGQPRPLLSEIDVLVCDYNYVFDPDIGLAAILNQGALRDGRAGGIDEAHNLGRPQPQYYSPRSARRCSTGADLSRGPRPTRCSASSGCWSRSWPRWCRGCRPAGLGPRPARDAAVELPAGRIRRPPPRLRRRPAQLFVYKREQDLWMADDRSSRSSDPDAPAPHARRGRQRVRPPRSARGRPQRAGENLLPSTPRDSSAKVLESRPAPSRCRHLEPFDFYRDAARLLTHRTDELYVPSPFPASNRLCCASATSTTTYRGRAAHYDRIADWIARLAHPSQTCSLSSPATDSSRRSATGCPGGPPPAGPGAELLRRGPVRFPRRPGRKRASPPARRARGIFAEASTTRGRCSPRSSWCRRACPAVDRARAAQGLLPGVLRPRLRLRLPGAGAHPGRAGGRPIFRSAEDRGVIVLMCQRFQDPRYARLLPSEWTDDDRAACCARTRRPSPALLRPVLTPPSLRDRPRPSPPPSPTLSPPSE